MRSICGIRAFALLLLRVLSQIGPIIGSSADENNDELVSWIRSVGGFIDPRQEIRLPYPDDKDSPPNVRGIFATETIKEGDKLLDLPWDDAIIVSDLPPGNSQHMCGTARSIRRELSLEDSRYGPYVTLLKETARTRLNLPNTWSSQGLILLERVVGDYVLPPSLDDVRRHLLWWERRCGENFYHDKLGADAALLLVTRAVGINGASVMAPFYDLYNHRNGYFKNTHVSGNLEEKRFQVFANRDIMKGEQIYNRYAFGTDEILRDYGFVELSPQFWTFTITQEPEQQVQF